MKIVKFKVMERQPRHWINTEPLTMEEQVFLKIERDRESKPLLNFVYTLVFIMFILSTIVMGAIAMTTLAEQYSIGYFLIVGWINVVILGNAWVWSQNRKLKFG